MLHVLIDLASQTSHDYELLTLLQCHGIKSAETERMCGLQAVGVLTCLVGERGSTGMARLSPACRLWPLLISASMHTPQLVRDQGTQLVHTLPA